MPVFNERGLMPPAPTGALVVLSSGESGQEEGSGSEATREAAGETSPPHLADLLRTLPNDDVAGEHPVRESPHPTGVTTRSKGTPEEAAGRGTEEEQTSADLPRRCLRFAPVGPTAGPTPVVKKKKGVTATFETQQPAAAVPPPTRKDGDGSRASAAGSSSRGAEACPQEKAISIAKPALEAPTPSSPAEVTKAQEPPVPSAATSAQALVPTPSLPPSIVSLGRDPPAPSDALEDADRRVASGRLELVSGWLRSDASVRAAWSQAVAASEEGKQAADLAAAAREAALKDAEAAKERRRVAEAELETLLNERATEARQREAWEEKLKAREDAVASRDTELEQSARAQVTERDCLEKPKNEVEGEKALMEAKANILANHRAAFDSLEKRSRKALRELYGRGLKEPLVTAEEGPTELLPQLVKALEGVAAGVGPMVEGEARALSASAMTRVFSHLHLRDSSTDLGALLEPVDEEHCATAAEAVKDQVEALLQKFLAIDPAPPTDGAAEPAATAAGTGDGDVVDDGAPLAGDGSA
nr:translation initiation factor IF-2-like [Aegilops tauschii subsp. strangulata]